MLIAVNPEADTYVISSNPNANQGTQTRLRIGQLSTPSTNRAALRFNLAAWPHVINPAVVKSATLAMVVETAAASAAAGEVVLWEPAPWVETTVTWNNMPALHSAVAAAFAFPTGAGTVTIDVKAVLIEALSVLGTLTPSFLAKKTDEATNANWFCHSREAASSANWPLLTIETYEPGRLPLLGIGV